MEINESIEFIYSWMDEKGSKVNSTFKHSWNGLTKEAPDSAYLHDQLAAFMKCIGLKNGANDD